MYKQYVETLELYGLSKRVCQTYCFSDITTKIPMPTTFQGTADATHNKRRWK